MRAIKYLVVALAIFVMLAVSAWVLRDTLIRRISNPMLDEYDLAVTDVSLDALATADATIGRLELAHENGTTILIEDLTLPIGRPGNRPRTYTAGKVTIATGNEPNEEPPGPADLIDRVLSLPDTLAGSEILIGELSIAPYDTIRDLRWTVALDQQSLHMQFDDNDFSVSVSGIDPTSKEIQVLSNEQRINANLRKNDAGIAISGGGSLDLAAWVPFAGFVRLMPEQVALKSGTADVEFVATIPYDVAVSPSLTGSINPSSPLHIDYSGAVDATTSIIVQSGSAIGILASFPEVEWTVEQEQASLGISHADWRDIPVSISDMRCGSDRTCSLSTAIELDDAKLPIGQAVRIALSSTQEVSFGEDGMVAAIEAGAKLSLVEFGNSGTQLERFEADLVSTGKLEQINSAWIFLADSIDTRVEGLSIGDDIAISAPLFLETFVATVQDQDTSANAAIFIPASQALLEDQTIAVPGLRGAVALEGAALSTDVTTVGLLQEAAIAASYNLASGSGAMSVSGGVMSFGAKTLSDRISPWQRDWNLSGGTVAIDIQADWERPESTLQFDAQSSVQLADIAGYYTDIAFTGLSTNIEAAYNSAAGVEIEPSSFSVALVEMGLPVSDISADFVLDASVMAVDVANLQMTAFDGAIQADPFRFRTGEVRNSLTLHAESIELSELLSIKGFEAIEVTGSINAHLPLTIEGKTVTISGGKLTGEPPGGVIRYLPGRATATTDASGIGLATRALSNFEYETLTSDVTYSQDGNLKLQMQLNGRNPDLDDNRPVVLNLGIENNVPQMLRSLQAARTVQEVLEQRMAQ